MMKSFPNRKFDHIQMRQSQRSQSRSACKEFSNFVCKHVKRVANTFRLLQELTQYLILDAEMEIEEHEESLQRLFKAADDSDSESSSSSSTHASGSDSSESQKKDRLQCDFDFSVHCNND